MLMFYTGLGEGDLEFPTISRGREREGRSKGVKRVHINKREKQSKCSETIRSHQNLDFSAHALKSTIFAQQIGDKRGGNKSF
jgi:hypothetical protein